MNLDFLNIFAETASSIDGNIASSAVNTANSILGNPIWLIVGIALIVVTILLLVFLKKIIVNSILGLILFAIVKFGLGIGLPTIPTLVVSIIFGPAGIGVMLLLKFLGLL